MHLSNYNDVPAQVNHNRSTKLRAAPSTPVKPARVYLPSSLFLAPPPPVPPGSLFQLGA